MQPFIYRLKDKDSEREIVLQRPEEWGSASEWGMERACGDEGKEGISNGSVCQRRVYELETRQTSIGNETTVARTVEGKGERGEVVQND